MSGRRGFQPSKVLYDESTLHRMAELQRRHAWDLNESISWARGIDLSRPLVPLDEDALLFPGAGSEERLAISQVTGLVIATCIYEMEECLIRLRRECWSEPFRRSPLSPELADLGELFFEEERKHSEVFRRYVDRFAEACGMDPAELSGILPKIENTRTEALLRAHLRAGGSSFWWIVALVEQEFLHLYRCFRPFKDRMDPLYYEIHEKHFEEEARHASFPYLMVELTRAGRHGPIGLLHDKADFVLAQTLQAVWGVLSLRRIQEVRKVAHRHPIFAALASALPKLHAMPSHRSAWRLFTSVPYASSFMNSNHHQRALETARNAGAVILPFPSLEESRLVAW